MVEEEPAGVAPFGVPIEWPQVIRAGAWVAPDGTRWHRRGGELPDKAVRRLAWRHDVQLLQVAGPRPLIVNGPQRDALLERLGRWLDGKSPNHVGFDVGEFRNDARNILLVIEEAC